MAGLHSHYPVVIIGAGPAGAATALSLRQRGVDVLLAEAGRLDRAAIGESIPPDTRTLFDQLGVLDAFLAQDHEPCLGSRSCWGGARATCNDFLTNPQGAGWHLERRRFDTWLAHCAARCGAHLQTQWRFQWARPTGRGYELAFSHTGRTRRVCAQLVVDATGTRGVFARQAGARKRYSDRLVCAAAHFKLRADSPLERLTYLEATDYGWWYGARLEHQRALVSVTSDPANFRRRRLSDPRVWLAHLAHTGQLGHRLHGSQFLPDSFRMHGIHSFVLDPVAGEHWLAVGDSAASFDPISAQGIYRALDGGRLAGAAIAARLDDPARGFSRYAGQIRQLYEDYLQMRDYLYRQEGRWPQASFWRDRAQPAMTG